MLAMLLPVLGPILHDALRSVFPDPEARAKAVNSIFEQLGKSDIAQLEVNKAEAQSNYLFVAGWRPFIGWVCGSALLYTYILVPMVVWLGFVFGKPVPKPPTLDANLWELMIGMLGLSAARTYEKVQAMK